MKKRIFTLLLALLTALTLTVPAWAQQQENDILIYDTESLLTEEQWTELELLARDLSWQYNCALYIVTVSDYEAYGSEPYAAAANTYNQEDFGIGDQRSGVLLLSMWDRDAALYVRDGDAGKAIGKYAQGLLAKSYLDYFRSDDWFGGFRAYLTTCGTGDTGTGGKPLPDMPGKTQEPDGDPAYSDQAQADLDRLRSDLREGAIKSPHLLDSISYCLTNGVQFSYAVFFRIFNYCLLEPHVLCYLFHSE